MSKQRQTQFGIAMRNFTKYPEMPSAAELIEYGVRMEDLGYKSLWAWDHILLGVEPNFPIHEALIILTAVAARTTRIKIGTGILVMPVRNPVLLAKELATIDHVSNGRLLLGAAVGWYKREFNSLGTDLPSAAKSWSRASRSSNGSGLRTRWTAAIRPTTCGAPCSIPSRCRSRIRRS